MSGTLKGEYPSLVFSFAPSEGEPFTMTRTEVADAMAFVRGMMAEAATCKHESDGLVYTSLPPQSKCKKCGKMWVT